MLAPVLPLCRRRWPLAVFPKRFENLVIDLLAYSERLALNFTEELGYNPLPGNPDSLPTVGRAMMRAKQR